MGNGHNWCVFMVFCYGGSMGIFMDVDSGNPTWQMDNSPLIAKQKPPLRDDFRACLVGLPEVNA